MKQSEALEANKSLPAITASTPKRRHSDPIALNLDLELEQINESLGKDYYRELGLPRLTDNFKYRGNKDSIDELTEKVGELYSSTTIIR